MLQVGSGSGSDEKATDPTGSGSSSLVFTNRLSDLKSITVVDDGDHEAGELAEPFPILRFMLNLGGNCKFTIFPCLADIREGDGHESI